MFVLICYQILLKFTISLHIMTYYGSLKQGHYILTV